MPKYNAVNDKSSTFSSLHKTVGHNVFKYSWVNVYIVV